MVVDAVGKPNPLEIDFKCLPPHSIPVSLIGQVDVFEKPAHPQVVAVVLVIHDVATAQSSHVEAVHQGLLLGAQLVPARDLVTDDFEVCKLFRFPNKALLIGSTGLRFDRRGRLKIRSFGCGLRATCKHYA